MCLFFSAFGDVIIRTKSAPYLNWATMRCSKASANRMISDTDTYCEWNLGHAQPTPIFETILVICSFYIHFLYNSYMSITECRIHILLTRIPRSQLNTSRPHMNHWTCCTLLDTWTVNDTTEPETAVTLSCLAKISALSLSGLFREFSTILT